MHDTISTGSGIAVRAARPSDAPLLATFDIMASSDPFGRPFWQDLLPSDTDPRAFAEALFSEDACGWGAVPEFIVIEVDGEPAAGCSVFAAKEPPADGPIRSDRLPSVGRRLGWDAGTIEAAVEAYETAWDQLPASYRLPQASAIVEAVAVLPGFRGRGLGHRLMETAKAHARALGHDSLGISVIHGNDRAARLYEAHFEPYATFHPASFAGGFPGVTKYRARL